MKKIATMKQIREAKRTEFLKESFNDFKKADLVKTSSAFFIAGAGSVAAAPLAKNAFAYSEEESEVNFSRALVIGVLGALSGFMVHEGQNKINRKDKRTEISKEIKELEDKFEKNLKNLNISYHNIFKSYVDDFETERDIYTNRYRALEISKELEEMKPKKERLQEEYTKLDNEEKEIAEKLKKLNKEKEDEEKAKKDVGYEDVPSYPTGKTELEKLREKFKTVRNNLKEKESEWKTFKKKYDKIQKEASEIYESRDKLINKDYPKVLANRESREEFEKFFIDGYKRLRKEVSDIRELGSTIMEVRFLSKRLKDIKRYDKFLEENYENFIKTYDNLMKMSTSTVGRLKNKNKERTYAEAPFWKIFQTYSNPQKHKASNYYINEVNDIIEGANEDFFKEKEKLTWYLKRNYQEDWLAEIGDFSKEEAQRLSELLKDYFTGKIGVDCDYFALKRAYREYLRDKHPDINDDVDEDHEYSEVSNLVDKLKKYIDSRDELFE